MTLKTGAIDYRGHAEASQHMLTIKTKWSEVKSWNVFSEKKQRSWKLFETTMADVIDSFRITTTTANQAFCKKLS